MTACHDRTHSLAELVLAECAKRGHDVSSLSPLLPCYPNIRMPWREHTKQRKQCQRTAKEVLELLTCQRRLRRDAHGWWVLSNIPLPPRPIRKPSKPKPPPPPYRGPRLVHSR